MKESVNGRSPVSKSMNHLTEWQIEQLAEGELPTAELSTATAHLDSCGRCAAEVDSYRMLFATLATLPRYAPSDEFAGAVMARLKPAPRLAPFYAWLRRIAPQTRRGWSVLFGLAVLPATPIIALFGWLLSHPLVSAEALMGWALSEARAGAADGFTAVRDWVAQAGALDLANVALSAASTFPMPALVTIFLLLAVAIPLSAWSLLRLLRSPSGNVEYAN